ncbi:MAG: M15 family metallopeptidase [Betaproteobacteria bacterium]
MKAILDALGISLDAIESRRLAFQPEPGELVVAETDELGRQHLLVAPAAEAWRAMKAAALADGIVVRIVSAFRSIDRQVEIVRAKLDRGQSLENILCVSAPPGFSEHHSGRAVDLTTDGVAPLEEEFEQTDAFRWLAANAGRFGYALSFPRDNPNGYAYEPWHWRYVRAA